MVNNNYFITECIGLLESEYEVNKAVLEYNYNTIYESDFSDKLKALKDSVVKFFKNVIKTIKEITNKAIKRVKEIVEKNKIKKSEKEKERVEKAQTIKVKGITTIYDYYKDLVTYEFDLKNDLNGAIMYLKRIWERKDQGFIKNSYADKISNNVYNITRVEDDIIDKVMNLVSPLSNDKNQYIEVNSSMYIKVEATAVSDKDMDKYQKDSDDLCKTVQNLVNEIQKEMDRAVAQNVDQNVMRESLKEIFKHTTDVVKAYSHLTSIVVDNKIAATKIYNEYNRKVFGKK